MVELTTTATRSYQDVLADFGGLLTYGFRYATLTEVTDLLTHFGITSSPTPDQQQRLAYRNVYRVYEWEKRCNGTTLSVKALFKQNSVPSSANTAVPGISMILNKSNAWWFDGLYSIERQELAL